MGATVRGRFQFVNECVKSIYECRRLFQKNQVIHENMTEKLKWNTPEKNTTIDVARETNFWV